MTISSTFRQRFQHTIRQIVSLSRSYPTMYHIIMFKANWCRQIKVYVYFSKNIVHDIISRRVLKVKICEKYKISGMLLILRIKIFRNISIIINKCNMNEYDSFKNVFSSIDHKERKMRNAKIIHHIKNCIAHFPSEHHFRPSIFNVTCWFRIIDI